MTDRGDKMFPLEFGDQPTDRRLVHGPRIHTQQLTSSLVAVLDATFPVDDQDAVFNDIEDSFEKLALFLKTLDDAL